MENEKAIRSQRLTAIRAKGFEPFQDHFERTHSLKTAQGLKPATPGVKIAGRIIQKRVLGKLAFLRLSDETANYQIILRADKIATNFKFWLKNLDLGDFIGVAGETFITQKGEPSLLVTELNLLTKALAPLPEKFHGLTNPEKCLRQRHLDLILNLATRKLFQKRSLILQTLRDFLLKKNFLEVETPILQTNPSGAIATPFTTHHAAFDLNCVLRIAPETYLKRCLIGGFERVFEFARCFRNEGLDPNHLQDFTMLELYAAYENYEFLIKLTEEIFQELNKITSSEIKFREQKISLKPPFQRLDFVTTVKEASGLNVETANLAEIRAITKKHAPEVPNLNQLGVGNLIDVLYKKIVRPKIQQPTFFTGQPLSLSPFARKSTKNPKRAERFQLVIAGLEIINGFSELTDPEDQAARFAEQAKIRAQGDLEALVADQEFVAALANGMPPAAGLGLGIDRLVALLTQTTNLKEAVLFPLMKPKSTHNEKNQIM